MSVYYNDSEPFVAQWLRNLIAAGQLPAGDVDERPIQEVSPDDVRSYTQAHFFAGIGGWPYALQLAGWGDRPAWTGSCPCPSFSFAGRGRGFADPRHLWPSWERLIRECCPPVVFGEQVAGAIGHGWWDLVATDLEAQGYAVAASVLGAHSVGAPHKRQRLWFVADANIEGLQGRVGGILPECASQRVTRSSGASMADTGCARDERERRSSETLSEIGALKDQARKRERSGPDVGYCGATLAHAPVNGRYARRSCDTQESAERGEPDRGGEQGDILDADRQQTGFGHNGNGAPLGEWWRVEPDVGRVAHGVSNRVGSLCGFGNAIVPQVAAAFVTAYLEASGPPPADVKP